jgi:signal recognition particle subunit SRP54
LTRQKGGTGKRLSSAERAKLKKQRERELRRKKRDARKK